MAHSLSILPAPPAPPQMPSLCMSKRMVVGMGRASPVGTMEL